MALLTDKLRAIVDAAGKGGGVEVSSRRQRVPAVREKVRGELAAILAASGFPAARIEVLSAYKPGYFWLVEKVLPALAGKAVHALTVRFAEEREDLTRAERAYAEPSRWLQELYPVDEVLARELGLPLDRIGFEIAEPGGPIYRVVAVDAKGAVVLDESFTPRTREIPLSNVLPEWGTARVTTGGLRVVAGGTVVCDAPLETDLEKFWGFYQEEVLTAVVAHVRKKTGGEPTFSKQPYFKRLLVDLRASEPDFRTGLDEEIVSSLEAVHDEIYFDTLDLLRGITRFDPEDKDAAADTSRSSAPGNVFPSLHPSLEGGPAVVRVVLEDWPAAGPEITVRWKEKGREEVARKTAFPALKPKETRISELVFDGRTGRVAERRLRIRMGEGGRLPGRRRHARRLAQALRRRPRRRSFPLSRARRPHPPSPLPVAGEGRAAGRRRGPRFRTGRRTRSPAARRTHRHHPRHHLAGHGRGDRPPARGPRRRPGLCRRPVLRRPRRARPRALPAVREVRLPAAAGHPQADPPGRRPPARQRGLVDQLSPPLRRAPGPRSRDAGGAQEDELRLRARGEPGRGRAGLRHAEERALPQPARRPLRRLGRGHGLPDGGQAAPARGGRPDPALRPLGPRHLPQPPRLPVARMGPAVLELHALSLPRLLDPQGLVRLLQGREPAAPPGAPGGRRRPHEAHRRGALRRSRDRGLEPQVLRPLRALVGPLGAAHERARGHGRGQHLRQAQGPDREPADAAGPGDLQRADARSSWTRRRPGTGSSSSAARAWPTSGPT
ncbi:MAG: hypothetical protein M0C28_01935 [Candidatus Moduliflexus flocculans]|nr:hypothetical protein [Candidatus Moduliflexus flocculans]